MNNNKEQLESLSEIKDLMERSSRFVSLSGMAGIAAGVSAVAGAVLISLILPMNFLRPFTEISPSAGGIISIDTTPVFMIMGAVFLSALSLAMYFSLRKARSRKIGFWDNMAKRFFLNLMIFMLTGAIFCITLIHYEIYFLVVPATLTFYGLALINISRFTFNEIAQLGILEILLGIISSFIIVYPLLFWTVGFGILHIIYGAVVYFKHERALH